MVQNVEGRVTVGRKVIDLTGQRFGRLTVIRRVPSREYESNSRWLVKCDCGTVKTVLSCSLKAKNGKTVSCGCYAKEQSAKNIKKITARYSTHERSMRILNADRRPGNNIARGVYTYPLLAPDKKGYIAMISVDGKRHSLICTHDKKVAISVRKEAERHVKDGTFDEWIKMWKSSKAG